MMEHAYCDSSGLTGIGKIAINRFYPMNTHYRVKLTLGDLIAAVF